MIANLQMTVLPLQPCPFCGGSAYYTKAVNGSNMIYCGCGPCGIRFKALNIYKPNGEWEPSMDVVAAWNRRSMGNAPQPNPEYEPQEVFDVNGEIVGI